MISVSKLNLKSGSLDFLTQKLCVLGTCPVSFYVSRKIVKENNFSRDFVLLALSKELKMCKKLKVKVVNTSCESVFLGNIAIREHHSKNQLVKSIVKAEVADILRAISFKEHT